jgi:hypothetical protein
MDEYNKELCEKIQKEFEEKFRFVFNRLDKLDNKMNWFYILAISSLITIIINIIKDVF